MPYYHKKVITDKATVIQDGKYVKILDVEAAYMCPICSKETMVALEIIPTEPDTIVCYNCKEHLEGNSWNFLHEIISGTSYSVNRVATQVWNNDGMPY